MKKYFEYLKILSKSILKIQDKIVSCILKILLYLEDTILPNTANNYYALFSGYKTTVEICDETIIAYNTAEGNLDFFEHGLPFLLST